MAGVAQFPSIAAAQGDLPKTAPERRYRGAEMPQTW